MNSRDEHTDVDHRTDVRDASPRLCHQVARDVEARAEIRVVQLGQNLGN